MRLGLNQRQTLYMLLCMAAGFLAINVLLYLLMPIWVILLIDIAVYTLMNVWLTRQLEHVETVSRREWCRNGNVVKYKKLNSKIMDSAFLVFA